MTTKILVVDDSHLERVLAERLLSKNADYETQLAESGREALRKIAAEAPDLVITDLVMPEIDGLELVRRMRLRHPEIPVILMTAYGQETTAVEALAAGAASYVPKSQRAERLMATVKRVAENAKINRCREELSPCMIEYHCRFAIGNDPQLIRALVNQVQRVMANMGFGDTVERIRIAEAVEEALLNAMYHGNLEIGAEELGKARSELNEEALEEIVRRRARQPKLADRRVLVVVRVNEGESRFVIRDEGRGFNVAHAAKTSGDRFAAGAASGMTLIRALMDDVAFNNAGNELVLCKRWQPQGKSAAKQTVAAHAE